ncbi:MAG: VWA domain-containing protein, partial [Acidobacteria bacterium]|nr:VWA domain-containing protein [Acidobacteriota bacterium]
TAGAADQKPILVSLGAVAQPEKVRETVRDHRLIVLFFDMTSMQADELLRAIAGAQKYLREQMTPADLVGAVVFGNRLSILANFTNDREALLRAVARLRPGKEAQLAGTVDNAAAAGEEAVTEDTGDAFTADETEFNIFNTDRKLAAIEGLCGLLRDIPGKKQVIEFAGGITQTGQENRSQLRSAVDAANRANVSLYTVDTRGLQASVPGGNADTGAAAGTAMFSGAAVFRQTASRQDSRETLATLSQDTGGRSFFDIGDFKEVFQQVQEDASGYYLLGYYSANGQKDGKWRDVKVKVVAPGAKVRHREGYYAAKDYVRFNTEDRERQLDEAMRAENPRVELPLAVEASQFRLNNDEVFVPVAVKLAASALDWAEKRGRRETEFDFAAEVRLTLSQGRVGPAMGVMRDTVKVKLDSERFQQVSQRAIVYQGGFILAPGSYRLKFLARENESGRIGTFEQDLLIPLRHTERLELSTILLSSQLEAVSKTKEVEKKSFAEGAKLAKSPLEMGGERIIPSVTRVFTTQQKMYVFFQAYVPAKVDPATLRAGLVFFRGGERLSETPMIEPAEVDAKTRVASFRLSLPLEKFAPGRYTVQAVTVQTGGGHAAFARGYFALRPPVNGNATPTKAPGQ